MKKILAILLAMVMVLSMTTAMAEGEKHELIYGSTTEISGDFAPSSWWTNNASDKLVREIGRASCRERVSSPV